MRLRLRPRLAAALGALVVLLAVVGVAAARSTERAGCGLPPPVPELSPQLRAIGDFGQSYDPIDRRGLADAALRVSQAVVPNFGGNATVAAGEPVAEKAVAAGQYDAVVIPLGSNQGSDGAPRAIEGLVSFLKDCRGQLYFHAVSYLGNDPPPSFPSISSTQARRVLASASVELVHTGDPFAPAWRDPVTGRTVPATAPKPSLPPAPGFGSP